MAWVDDELTEAHHDWARAQVSPSLLLVQTDPARVCGRTSSTRCATSHHGSRVAGLRRPPAGRARSDPRTDPSTNQRRRTFTAAPFVRGSLSTDR
jgi:hypothetical protein